MCSIPKVRLPLSTGTDFDFEGGDITSDAGVILVNEFCTAIGLQEALRKHLEAHPMREYDDWRVAYQRVIMLVAGYLRDVDSERLGEDPAFAHVLGGVASQPTLSRRLSSMGESDGELLRLAIREVQRNVARVAPGREFVVVDVDSTLAPTFGRKQEGSAFNYHYQAEGYHPLVATDTLRRECIDVRLREGTDYCSKGSGPFIERVLDDVAGREPRARIGLRGDSGFAAPEVYLACEKRKVTYAVRLKLNRTLARKALARTRGVFRPGVARTFTGEFTYRAGSWDRRRRVVFEAVQHEGQLFPEFTFVVTNSDARSCRVMEYYRGRGEMEQIIGEVKELSRGCVCSKSMDANDFRCQLAMLAHSVLSWMRMLCLGGEHASDEPRTIVWEFVRIGARRVVHGRRTCFHISSAYARREQFFRAVVRCDEVARELAGAA